MRTRTLDSPSPPGRRRGRCTGPLLGLVTCLVALLLPGTATAASGPAYDGDFPDPFVLRGSTGLYVAYATNTAGVRANVQVMSSRDLRGWSAVTDALPRLPVWAQAGHTWAPAVLRREGSYVLYYTVRHAASGRQCISVAVSTRGPKGPFVDRSREPLVCQLELGGSIDPDPFVAPDGTVHLHWKSDDNALRRPSKLWGSRLTADGLRLADAEPSLLLEHAADTWERPLIEGPQMLRVAGSYHLLFAGNWWESASAGVGHARCRTPLGPCTRTAARPWLARDEVRVGPAGASVFGDGTGRRYVAYHAWTPGQVGYRNGGRRSLWVSALSFADGRPALRR